MADIETIKWNFEKKYNELEELIDDWIADQECTTEEQWKALMEEAKQIDWEVERNIIIGRIENKWDMWTDEQTGFDTLNHQ
mgnify:CR=1 FL=1|tara:strand:+ start:4826 stop:5068 length:243 start_codon:yes stop_codon:yes gene_type:complete